MKIAVFSDLHREFAKVKRSISGCDVLVFAGDIDVGAAGMRWVLDNFKDMPVVYVAGNHEFYAKKRTHSELVAHLRKMSEGTNVHYLENDFVDIDGVRFAGCTMWTDYNLFGKQHLSELAAARGLNDFDNIRMSNKKFINTEYIKEKNTDSQLFLNDVINNSDYDGKLVVVTHHAPSINSVEQKYKFDDLTPAYASRLEHLMVYGKNPPKVWFHGHIHSNSDYMICDTRVVCNPYGYHGHYLNKQFIQCKIVEV